MQCLQECIEEIFSHLGKDPNESRKTRTGGASYKPSAADLEFNFVLRSIEPDSCALPEEQLQIHPQDTHYNKRKWDYVHLHSDHIRP